MLSKIIIILASIFAVVGGFILWHAIRNKIYNISKTLKIIAIVIITASIISFAIFYILDFIKVIYASGLMFFVGVLMIFIANRSIIAFNQSQINAKEDPEYLKNSYFTALINIQDINKTISVLQNIGARIDRRNQYIYESAGKLYILEIDQTNKNIKIIDEEETISSASRSKEIAEHIANKIIPKPQIQTMSFQEYKDRYKTPPHRPGSAAKSAAKEAPNLAHPLD